MRGFDTKIEKKLPELSCSYMTYSRYADDMSISFKQYLTKDVLEEKFSNYVQSIKNADEEKMEGILQQFNQEQFVATDNFERKYINQKIEELKTLITASSQFSEPQKKIYI
jgi:hypothetical protein